VRLSLQTVPRQEAQQTPQRCVSTQGFSLHAEVRCAAAHERHKLEHLCRYARSSRAAFSGLAEAVREMKRLMLEARR